MLLIYVYDWIIQTVGVFIMEQVCTLDVVGAHSHAGFLIFFWMQILKGLADLCEILWDKQLQIDLHFAYAFPRSYRRKKYSIALKRNM